MPAMKDLTMQQVATSMTVAGAALGSFLEVIPRSFGFRRTLVGPVCLLYITGAILCGFPELWLLLLGRFVVGVAAGFAGIVAPVLLAETSAPQVRGKLTAMHQVGVTLGVLFSCVSGLFFVRWVEEGWRYVFYVSVVPPIVLLVGALLGFIPESPRWLIRRPGDRAKQGKKEAFQMLLGLRPLDYDVRKELRMMLREQQKEGADQADEGARSAPQPQLYHPPTLHEEHMELLVPAAAVGAAPKTVDDTLTTDGMSAVSKVGSTQFEDESRISKGRSRRSTSGGSEKRRIKKKRSKRHHDSTDTFLHVASAGAGHILSVGGDSSISLNTLCCSPRHRHLLYPVFVGVMLILAYTLSGVYVVVFYSSRILDIIEVHDPLVSTVIVFFLYFVASVVGAFLSDRFGRRSLLLIGYIVMAASLAALGLVLELVGRDYRASVGWIAVACVVVYMCAFAIGPGTATYVVLGEIVPTSIRVKAFGIFMAVNWAVLLALSLFTLNLIILLGGGHDPERMRHGAGVLFLMFCGVCCIAALSVGFLIPETKGASLESVRDTMLSRWRLVDAKRTSGASCAWCCLSESGRAASQGAGAIARSFSKEDASLEGNDLRTPILSAMQEEDSMLPRAETGSNGSEVVVGTTGRPSVDYGAGVLQLTSSVSSIPDS
jgi:MFS family permease